MYTVNALNEIIVEQNNGVLDKRFQLYWPRYENSFILTVGSATGSTWFMGFIQGLKKGNEDLEILYQLRIDWLEKELENLID